MYQASTKKKYRAHKEKCNSKNYRFYWRSTFWLFKLRIKFLHFFINCNITQLKYLPFGPLIISTLWALRKFDLVRIKTICCRTSILGPIFQVTGKQKSKDDRECEERKTYLTFLPFSKILSIQAFIVRPFVHHRKLSLVIC